MTQIKSLITIDNEAAKSHDFDTISPNAYTLLVMKGGANIPFAREAVALLKQAVSDQYQDMPNFGAGRHRLHATWRLVVK